ncbi:LCP family protein [Actinomyces gaoshouyii]|uniref:LCP family protein n=1 Tax=Actinomyces gaoshouyii TaxID=1960083 RepID=UPI001F0B643A|nr:LCP family protein [Actinomyces gaoshouyii]
MSSSPAAPGPAPARAPKALIAFGARARRSARAHRALTILIAGLVLVLALALGDLGLLAHRIRHVPVAMPRPASALAEGDATVPYKGETWLIIGTDSRLSVPGGPDRYGDASEDRSGARADVVVLLQPGPGIPRAIVLPRDLTLTAGGLQRERLTTSYLQGPQSTVDLLCSALGVPTAHLVTVDMGGFASLVDAVGGLTLDIPEPVRDEMAGLDIPTSGAHTLSGIDALALVRSRHPQILRNGQWTALSEAEGAQRRSESTGLVMSALITALAQEASTPWGARSLARAVAGALTTDEGTGLIDLARLGWDLADGVEGAQDSRAVEVTTVPAPTQGGGFIALPTPETYSALWARGYAPGTCAP